MRTTLVAVLLLSCASIKAPDGGPPDTHPPALLRTRTRQQGSTLYLRLRWDEFLSPASELSGRGLWVNPPLPFRAHLEGKVLRLRIDSAAGCLTVWGGPGLKDFTEGNPFPPAPLWTNCPPAETLQVPLRLDPPPDEHTPAWIELERDSTPYRFLVWQGTPQVGFLPPGPYHGYAWEDKDNDGRWSLTEPVWLPESTLYVTAMAGQDSLRRLLASWSRWLADTFPPALPRPVIREPGWGVFVFREPVTLLRGQGRQLSEYALLLVVGSPVLLADSTGNLRQDTFQLTPDTQKIGRQAFWPAAANLHFPQHYFTLSHPLPDQDTFWAATDTTAVAAAFVRGEEVYLDPLPTWQTTPFQVAIPEGDTLRLTVPGQKARVTLPLDTTGQIQRWRIYGPPMLGRPFVADATPGQVVWLPPGHYELVGLPVKGPFWQPIQIQQNKPRLQAPPLQRHFLTVPTSHP